MNKQVILTRDWKENSKLVKTAIRTHEDVFVLKKGDKEYIVKKISSTELKVLKCLSSLKMVLQPIEVEKIGEKYWAVYSKVDGALWGNSNRAIYSTVIKTLAQFHFYSKSKKNYPKLKSPNYKNDLSKIKQMYSDNSLSLRMFSKIEELVSELPSNRSLIHNDFLPFNILINDEQRPLFIDFENCSLDFCERDLGRFLTDLNTFIGTVDYKNKRYYPYEFYSHLKETYLTEMSRLDHKYDICLGSRRILLAEIWNHLIVTEVLIEKNDITCDWFELNYQALKRLTI